MQKTGDKAALKESTDNDGEKDVCKRHSLLINFKEIHWDWIIAPKYFNAYYCSGSCTNNNLVIILHSFYFILFLVI